MPYYDKNGRQLCPGDLVRSPHFVARGGIRYWLYHVVVHEDDGRLRMVPTSHLEPSKRKGGGSCLVDDSLAQACEIIDGHGPGDCSDFRDRPRHKHDCPACEGRE